MICAVTEISKTDMSFEQSLLSVLDNKCKYDQSVKPDDFSCAFKCKSQHISSLELFIHPITLWANATTAVVSWWNKVGGWHSFSCMKILIPRNKKDVR